MNILLTGSTGFLGMRVCELLHKKHTVICFKGDLLKPQTLASYDCVIHLAAQVPKTPSENTKKLYEDNIRMTKNLLAAFRTKQIIFASTIEVYGAPVGTNKINEMTPVDPKTWYGKSKLESERLLPHATILRFTGLYGAGDTITRAIPNFIRASLFGTTLRIIDGGNRRDYLHVDDAARAVVAAAEFPTEGIFCIGTGTSVSIKKIASTIAPRLKKIYISSGKPRQDLVFTITKAKRKLNFYPKYTFPDRIKEEIAWMKKTTPPIVFDLDGTILDTTKRRLAIEKQYPNVPFKIHAEDAQFLTLDTIVPTMMESLAELSATYPLYIITMRHYRGRLLTQFKQLGLHQYFPDNRVITTQNKTQTIATIHPKPLVVIGDTEVDIEAAKANNISNIAVTWGIRNKQFLKAQKPDILLADPTKLIEIITGYDKQSYHRYSGV